MNSEEHPYIALARQAIRHYLETGDVLNPARGAEDPPPTGVFVSLHEPAGPGEPEGSLRGCVGSYRPRAGTLKREIAQSAVAAAVSDPRFPPLLIGEIDALTVTVYLLEEPEPIDSPDALDPSRYGLIIKGPGDRTGLLLPAIPGIATAAQQIELAKRKASFSPDDPVRMFRFAATIVI